MKIVVSQLRNQWMGALALFVALAGGTAWAATELEKNEVKSKHIGNGQVKNADLANDAVDSPKVADGSLLDDDFAAGQLPQGPTGERGEPGLPGEQGPQGERGPAGSPDTPGQIRDKLAQVDGSGSGIDADQLDGVDSSVLPRKIYETKITFDPGNLAPGSCHSTVHFASVNIRTTDHVLLTGGFKGGYFLPAQLTAYVGEFDDVNPTICNNGTVTTDPPEITLNILVLR